VVHFAGPQKPWQLHWNARTGELSGTGSEGAEGGGFLSLWWALLFSHVLQPLREALEAAGGPRAAGVSDLVGRVACLTPSDAQRALWTVEGRRERLMQQLAQQPSAAAHHEGPPALPAAGAVRLGPTAAGPFGPAAAAAAAGASLEAWERGQVDFLGAASFDQIQRIIDENLRGPGPAAPH